MAHRSVFRTELTPVSFLERSACVFPEKIAVVHGRRRYTYRQLEARVNRLASALRAAGLGRHDRVAFLCPNIPAMLEAHYGVPAAGGFLDAELEPLVKPLDLSGVRVIRVDDTGEPGDAYEDFLGQGTPDPVPSWLEEIGRA